MRRSQLGQALPCAQSGGRSDGQFKRPRTPKRGPQRIEPPQEGSCKGSSQAAAPRQGRDRTLVADMAPNPRTHACGSPLSTETLEFFRLQLTSKKSDLSGVNWSALLTSSMPFRWSSWLDGRGDRGPSKPQMCESLKEFSQRNAPP